MANQNFDAIVIGSGISGGWAAKELTEKGLKVLLLERGRNVEHVKDYVSATKDPWEMMKCPFGKKTPNFCWNPLKNASRKEGSANF